MPQIQCAGPWYRIQALAGQPIADVWLFGEIGWEVTAQTFLDQLKAINGITDLHVHINSVGGSVFEGLAIYNLLRSHPGNVEVTVEGFALSMGSVIAMAGKTVRMQAASMLMIHNPAGGAYGTAEDMRKMAMTLDQVRDVLAEVYAAKSGQAVDAITSWMDAETWFTAAEALEQGFIDEVVQTNPEEQMQSMAATARDVDLSRFTNVPASVRAMAKGAGSNPEHTPAAPAAHEEHARMPNAAPLADDKAADIQASAIAAERGRIASIEAAFAKHPGHDDLRSECIVNGVSIADASAKLLEAIAAKQQATPSGRVVVTEDAIDKFRAGATAAIYARANPNKRKLDDTTNEFRGLSLYDLARESLRLANVSCTGRSRTEIVGLAFTTGSANFTTVLRDAANKALIDGYDAQPEIYSEAAMIVPISDFKTMYMAGLGAFSDLDEIKEHDEYKFGDIGQIGQSFALATYGKMFNISRKAIINDDLNAFVGIPSLMGAAARRKLGDLFAAVLTGNQTMDEDSTALFHSNHSNLYTTAAPSTTVIEGMAALMRKQTAPGGTAYLNIAPKCLLVPVVYESQAVLVAESTTEIASSQNNSSKKNTALRYGLKVLADARFDANSATTYYLTADPMSRNAMVMGLLDGVDAPQIEQESLWTVDGAAFKVRVDGVAAAVNYRHFVRAA